MNFNFRKKITVCSLVGVFVFIVAGGIAFAWDPAELTTTGPLSGNTVTFEWNTVTGANAYWLFVGSRFGRNNIANSGRITATEFEVTRLPANGSTVYVRLWTLKDGRWKYTDKNYVSGDLPEDPTEATVSVDDPSSVGMITITLGGKLLVLRVDTTSPIADINGLATALGGAVGEISGLTVGVDSGKLLFSDEQGRVFAEDGFGVWIKDEDAEIDITP